MHARIGDGDEPCRSSAAIIGGRRDSKQIAQQRRSSWTSAGARSGHAERRRPAEIYFDAIVLESSSTERALGSDNHWLDRRRYTVSGKLRTLGNEADTRAFGFCYSDEALQPGNQRRPANVETSWPYTVGDPGDDRELRRRIPSIQIARAVSLGEACLARRCESGLETHAALEQ